jgi:hypothetical protein
MKEHFRLVSSSLMNFFIPFETAMQKKKNKKGPDKKETEGFIQKI